MKIKSFQTSKDSSFKNDNSSRILNNKNNIFKEKDIEIKIIPDKTKKEKDNKNERNIMNRIKSI